MAYNPNNINGQATMAASAPVVIASNQSAVPTSQTDTAATGTISATDVLGGTPAGTGALISTAPTTNSFVALALPGGGSNIDIMFTGTATGTYYFEYSMDSTTGSDGSWVTGNFRQSGVLNTVLTSGATANGVYRGNGAGFKYFRIRNVGGTTPSNPVTIRVTNGGGTAFLNASLPAGTNVVGALTANQSVNVSQMNGVATTMGNGVAGTGVQRIAIASDNTAVTGLGVGATGSATPANAVLAAGSNAENGNLASLQTIRFNFGDGFASGSQGLLTFNTAWNGSNLDRVRNNYNTTTGDTGAKTTTFSGATQTNYNQKSAFITVLCGTVSGTTPTLTAQLQWSPDAGTTWLAIGPASTAVTATGNTVSLLVGPNNWSQAAGATAANLTTGATQTVAINAPLPRTWRLTYVIGGTTPSFAITAVYVNYQGV